ncbi:uncharacterized protein METZ01_LOCUS37422 [marine metagenome]|uniref:Uncharacterized protein n=1 Tax=marine metagenome TaxID=408172 RepID=A0A381R151_9ZZZZ
MRMVSPEAISRILFLTNINGSGHNNPRVSIS